MKKRHAAKEMLCNTPLQISVYRVVSKELSLRGQLTARGNLPEKGYDFYLMLVKCERFSQEIPTAPLGPRNDILNQLVINCSLNSNFSTCGQNQAGAVRFGLQFSLGVL